MKNLIIHLTFGLRASDWWYFFDHPGFRTFTVLFFIGFGAGILLALISNPNSNSYSQPNPYQYLLERLKNKNQT